jgi:hypothetical protein
MVRTQIQLTERQARLLRSLAARQGISMAELIRRTVDGMVQAQAAVTTDERKRRALAVVGRFGSGRADVSRHHDRDLAEAFRR